VRCEKHGLFEGLCGGIIFRKYLRHFLFYWERIKTPFVVFSHLWRKSLTRVTSSWFGNFHFTKKVLQILDLFDLYWRMKWKKVLLSQIWGLTPCVQLVSHTALSLLHIFPKLKFSFSFTRSQIFHAQPLSSLWSPTHWCIWNFSHLSICKMSFTLSRLLGLSCFVKILKTFPQLNDIFHIDFMEM
jgi:hypothetical protein